MAEHFHTPTDLGYALVSEQDGDVTVAVCAKPDGDAYAVHYRVRRLRVETGVRLVPTGAGRRTDKPVAVTGEAGGVVSLRARPVSVLPAAALR